jgi:wyosine [tRNA(Phe)-imidazoG37] synthetase (radical SAM superfamily)
MANQKLKIYTQHSRHWQSNHYVYPVISRRSGGLSIGVNLNPDKACNFDCVYCCVDRSTPSKLRHVDLAVLRGELDEMLQLAISGQLFAQPPLDQTPPQLRRLNDVAFSGEGEPTACPQFAQACQLAAGLLAAHGQTQAKIIIITNATLFHRPAVAKALEYLDQHNGQIWAKLDAGTEEYYRQIERTTIPLSRVLDNILAAGRHRPLVIQSLFIKLDGQGPSDAEIAAYVQRLRELVAGGCQIEMVQVYTVARPTALSSVQPLEDTRLDHIAAQVSAAGLPVKTYYGV